MTFIVWQAGDAARIASSRLVLRAAEVPLLQQANALRDRLERLVGEQQRTLDEAAAAAQDEGFARGLDVGRRAAQAEAAAMLLKLAEAAAAERERRRNEVAALALEVVRKLIGSLAADVALVALADTAAELLPAQPVALVVHPERCDAVRARLAAAEDFRWEVRGDPACALDACRLETPHGSVDVALEPQLARLAAAWGAAR